VTMSYKEEILISTHGLFGQMAGLIIK